MIIGRNEGDRLSRCLASARTLKPLAYVDSGSTDDSVRVARDHGAMVAELTRPPQFSAARARNAGMRLLLDTHPDLAFLQMIDGDCELREGWVEKAYAVLQANPELALVFGRRRERHAGKSVYNAVCDDEWNVPVGEAAGCGGDAMFRVAALREVGGYNEAMIAGEDSELSMRLRKRGWRLECIDAEMTWHDADMHRFSQYWTRARRAGHGYAEMAHLHPDARWPDWLRTCRSIVFWGGLLPLATIGAALLAVLHHPLWGLVVAVLALPWPLKIVQLALRQRRRGLGPKVCAASAVLMMFGKPAQLLGLAGFHLDRLRGRASQIIEYKGPRPA